MCISFTQALSERPAAPRDKRAGGFVGSCDGAIYQFYIVVTPGHVAFISMPCELAFDMA